VYLLECHARPTNEPLKGGKLNGYKTTEAAMRDLDSSTVLRIYPPPPQRIPLRRLYLKHEVHAIKRRGRPFVYTNYVVSLDGRIALEDPLTGQRGVPGAIANPRDWRLFQELAAQADALVSSARYLRQLASGTAQDLLPINETPEYADLLEWRRAHQLAPQPAVVILSSSLDLPLQIIADFDRPIFVATGREADAARVRLVEQAGAQVLLTGPGRRVEGASLVEALRIEGLTRIYAVAGPQVLDTLLRARRLDRLYLTQVFRLLGGESYATLLEGMPLQPPADFTLHAMYYDTHEEARPGQIFAIYETR
jgi:riboflavin biosynthesis pyrimidine reductase